MAATYLPIATTTLGSSASSYTFSSIPSTYTDLVIVTSGTGSANASFKLQFNSDTGSNYSVTYLYGDGGGSATSGRASNQTEIGAMGRIGTSQANSLIHIMNYSNTSTYKNVIGRGNLSTQLTIMSVGTWRSTLAINSIKLTPESGTIDAGAILTIYGIKAA